MTLRVQPYGLPTDAIRSATLLNRLRVTNPSVFAIAARQAYGLLGPVRMVCTDEETTCSRTGRCPRPAPGVRRTRGGGRHPGGENPTPRMGAVLLGGTQFNYLGRSQNPKHPYLNGAVADFALYSRAEPPDAAS